MAAAIIGGLLGPAPSAVAAPAPGRPEVPSAAESPETSAGGLPPVWPRPQSLRAAGPPVTVSTVVTLVAPADADPYALGVLRSALRAAGARTVTDADPGDRLPADGLVVHAGGPSADDALRAPARGDLPSGGYRLATGLVRGRATLALSGVGPDGLFHAAQTLRQLSARAEKPGASRALPGVSVRDWPATRTRGITEGFSTARRGRTDSAWPNSTSWAARSRTAICTRRGTTHSARPAGATRTPRGSAPSSGSWPTAPGATTSRSAGHSPRDRPCASPPTRTCGRWSARWTRCGRWACAPSSSSSRT